LLFAKLGVNELHCFDFPPTQPSAKNAANNSRHAEFSPSCIFCGIATNTNTIHKVTEK